MQYGGDDCGKRDLDSIFPLVKSMPRVLYLGMAYDYGKPERGASYEQMNFYSSLCHAGYDVCQFDFLERQRVLGTNGMRKELLEVAGDLDVDVVFSVLF